MSEETHTFDDDPVDELEREIADLIDVVRTVHDREHSATDGWPACPNEVCRAASEAEGWQQYRAERMAS